MLDGQSLSAGMREELSYDKLVNIQTLKRDGGTTSSYHYTGNRLTSLSGGLTGSYTYDANGNAITDRSGFAYTYNHLNLPGTASKPGVSISYSYDALGNKRKSIGASGAGITRDYLPGGIEYKNGVLDRIATPAGYITFSGSTPVYQYYLSDHLGNVRTVFSASGGTATVVQQQDYYPFGLRKALAGSGVNAYLYNGKELQGELGQYDYGARFYDPVVGRWNVVDPLADHPQQIGISPYAAMNNNPILYVDPDGQLPIIPILWAAYEVGSAIYDGYQAYKAVSDKNASRGEKVAAVGGVLLSAALPGGGYGTAAKTTVKAVDKAMDAKKVVSKADDTRKATNKGADFVVTPDGTVVPTSQSRMKEVFEKAGFKKEQATKTAESGEIYTVPTKHGNVDVRTMEGSKNHPKRAVFTESGTNSPVKVGGGKFKNNEPKQVRREQSHLIQKD